MNGSAAHTVVILIASPERLHDAERAVGLERHGRELRRVVRRRAGGHGIAGAEAIGGRRGGSGSDGREEEAMLLMLLLLDVVVVVVVHGGGHVRRQREA